jgi:NADPH:quinone reductase-like Zn-dependent oxidoreductase
MATMKAIRMHGYGGPEVLSYDDVARPEPGADEVLIRVRAAAVNPVDWKIREGLGKEWFGHQLPFIPGCDLAGIVESAGSAVQGLQPGDAVFGFVNLKRCGAYAEFALATEGEVIRKPQSLDFVHAAAVPVGALTSWQALFDLGHLAAGQRVLIHGAAGGVGSMAVQLAKSKRAFVIGTASARNAQFLRGLGVDQVIDYQAVRFEEAVHDLDVVFDTIGGDTQERSFGVLKKGGVLVSTVSEPPEARCAEVGVQGAMFLVQPNAAQLAEIAQLIEGGKVRPFVETILPLREARQAQELSQGGHTRGKIVLEVGG